MNKSCLLDFLSVLVYTLICGNVLKMTCTWKVSTGDFSPTTFGEGWRSLNRSHSVEECHRENPDLQRSVEQNLSVASNITHVFVQVLPGTEDTGAAWTHLPPPRDDALVFTDHGWSHPQAAAADQRSLHVRAQGLPGEHPQTLHQNWRSCHDTRESCDLGCLSGLGCFCLWSFAGCFVCWLVIFSVIVRLTVGDIILDEIWWCTDALTCQLAVCLMNFGVVVMLVHAQWQYSWWTFVLSRCFDMQSGSVKDDLMQGLYLLLLRTRPVVV